MTRPRNSLKTRRECFEVHRWFDHLGRARLTCHICLQPIDPAREQWDAEHVIRRVLKPSDSPEDVLPAHAKSCHPEKTAIDNRETAKGKRVRDRHFGIKRAKGFYKSKGVKYDWSRGRYVRPEDGGSTS